MAGMVVTYDRTREDVANSIARRWTALQSGARARSTIAKVVAVCIAIGVILGYVLATNLLFGLVLTVGVTLVLVVMLPRRMLTGAPAARSKLVYRWREASSDAVFGRVSVSLQDDGVRSEGPIGTQMCAGR